MRAPDARCSSGRAREPSYCADWPRDCCVGSVCGVAEVGSYASGASPYGVMDMAGNLWEWVKNWYTEDYYEISPSSNPPGPSTGSEKGVRGGSWFNRPRYMRSANRHRRAPDYAGADHGFYHYGFRCARDAE